MQFSGCNGTLLLKSTYGNSCASSPFALCACAGGEWVCLPLGLCQAVIVAFLECGLELCDLNMLHNGCCGWTWALVEQVEIVCVFIVWPDIALCHVRHWEAESYVVRSNNTYIVYILLGSYIPTYLLSEIREGRYSKRKNTIFFAQKS